VANFVWSYRHDLALLPHHNGPTGASMLLQGRGHGAFHAGINLLAKFFYFIGGLGVLSIRRRQISDAMTVVDSA
jgi:hypothetical protein